MAELTVDLPPDMIEAMQAEAASRGSGMTVDKLVKEAFQHVHGRVDPARHIQ